jgi:hypothetical protein
MFSQSAGILDSSVGPLSPKKDEPETVSVQSGKLVAWLVCRSEQLGKMLPGSTCCVKQSVMCQTL